jgi:hypothetical protein
MREGEREPLNRQILDNSARHGGSRAQSKVYAQVGELVLSSNKAG